MKKRDTWFLIACILVLAALIFFAPQEGWQLRAWLSPQLPGGATSAIGTSSAGGEDLAAQNEALKAQLAELENIASQIPNASTSYVRAMVYSRYPFNFKNELLINAGSRDGITAGKAVIFQEILIGTVENAFSDSALVETVLDSNFKMPVRVGSAGYDALLVGGASPALTSIVKTARINAGDIVYTAAPGIPYGLPVAIVAATSTSPDNLFEDATLNFAYDMNAVQTVLVAQ